MMLENSNVTKNPEELRSYLEDINTAAHDASCVVHRLREFYKVDAATEMRDRVDLNKTINDTISLTRPKWKSEAQSTGRDIEFDLKLGDIPEIPGNPEEIREVLTNLIFNAVDAMPEGGTLTIGTETDNDQVLITIRDNGTGMSPEIRQHCFEPFYSTDSSNGSGLGLVVAASIVQRHNGMIECDSVLGEGTEFTIKLPVSIEPTKLSEGKTLNGITPELRILVVDDEMLIRKLLVQFLENEGHKVETAATGREGYDKFKSAQYDLIITDWAMPEMNGAELCQNIKHENPNIPIILMTGFDGIRRQEANQTIAADIVIGKPITRKDLLDSIKRIPAANKGGGSIKHASLTETCLRRTEPGGWLQGARRPYLATWYIKR